MAVTGVNNYSNTYTNAYTSNVRKNNAKETTLGSEVDSFGFYKILENDTVKCYRYLSSKSTANCE